MKTVKTFVTLAAMLVAGTALAQGADKKPAAAAPPPAEKPAAKPPEMAMPMKAPAEMDPMKWMVGTWKCDGKQSMGGKEMPAKGTYKMAWDLDNMWLVGHYEAAKAKGMPKTFKGVDYYTYDDGKKEYVQLSIDNMGGWGKMTSKGLEGDKLAWTGKAMMGAKEIDSKQTITKKSDKELTVDIANGDETYNATCKK